MIISINIHNIWTIQCRPAGTLGILAILGNIGPR